MSLLLYILCELFLFYVCASDEARKRVDLRIMHASRKRSAAIPKSRIIAQRAFLNRPIDIAPWKKLKQPPESKVGDVGNGAIIFDNQ